jgi:hypothetical protein
MANTTNYNWETPDDTDLVKDGAAAIRTLGSSIDTTTKNLNPQTTTGALAYRSATANVNTALPIGTAGQILAVSGGVPAWINNDQGDITEVAAGTGISVASGTGPVPTVSINTAVTADLTTAQTLTNKTLTSPVLTLALNAQTATYTVVLGDASKLVTMSVASANDFQIPTNASVAFPTGTVINVIQIGAGQTTIKAVTSGTTTISSTGASAIAPKLRAQYSAASCIKVATDTWYVVGDIA